jgi:hypothetical protein
MNNCRLIRYACSACENKNCESSGPFQWALRRGKKHAKDIRRYIQLCRDCHKRYDGHAKAQIDPSYFVAARAVPGGERPAVISPRVYKKHRLIIRKASKKLKISHAGVVRRALEHLVF